MLARFFRWAVLLAACVAIAALSRDADASLNILALSGQSPYGNDATFASFSPPSLNNFGEAAFSASLAGTGVTTANDGSIWIAGQGAFNEVAREGNAAPGPGPDNVFVITPSVSNSALPLSDTSEVAFNATLGDGVAANIGSIWAGNHESLRLVAYTGMQAPGAAEGQTFYASNARFSLSRSGRVAIASNLMQFQSVVDDGLWVETSNGLEKVALAGDAAPGMGQDVKFVSLPAPSLQFSSTGQVAFFGRVTGPGISTANDDGTWIGSPQNFSMLVREGMPMESVGPEVIVRASAPTGINSSGQVTMGGTLSGPGISSNTNASVVLIASTEDVTIAVRQGDPAPGGTDTDVFTGFSYEPSLGSGGHIGFYASSRETVGSGISRNGVWTGKPGELELVARQGEMAPGVAATWEGLFRATPAINRFGQIAFRADLRDVATLQYTESLWATDLDGNPVLITRRGDMIEVAEQDLRTILSLNAANGFRVFAGDDDGRARIINDLGQVAFHARFTDGTSGIFISNAVAHLPGDFNSDSVVDAADYVVWRKRGGSAEEYELLREFFGRTADFMGGFGPPASQLAVPEPATAWLVLLASLTFHVMHSPFRANRLSASSNLMIISR